MSYMDTLLDDTDMETLAMYLHARYPNCRFITFANNHRKLSSELGDLRYARGVESGVWIHNYRCDIHTVGDVVRGMDARAASLFATIQRWRIPSAFTDVLKHHVRVAVISAGGSAQGLRDALEALPTYTPASLAAKAAELADGHDSVRSDIRG